MLTVILLALASSVLWGLTLWLRPFARCPKCKGTGHIKRGLRRRPVCPRCKGRKRIQRRGSRAIHRLVFRIRDGQRTAARYQREDNRHE
jgi:DnaJ-class molecular chaperone